MKVFPVLLIGSLTLAGCSASQPQVLQGTWSAEAPPGAFLVLEENTLHGNDGCNSFFGTWIAEEDQLLFEGVGKTEMFCEGVDDWLSQLNTATLIAEGTQLEIKDAAGQMLGSVAKQPS